VHVVQEMCMWDHVFMILYVLSYIIVTDLDSAHLLDSFRV
jgi:hypothetical protein